jgi:hypothetical protein
MLAKTSWRQPGLSRRKSQSLASRNSPFMNMLRDHHLWQPPFQFNQTTDQIRGRNEDDRGGVRTPTFRAGRSGFASAG